jgi:hypothetical protein
MEIEEEEDELKDTESTERALIAEPRLQLG